MNQISQKLSEKQIALAAVDRTVAAELSIIHGAHATAAITVMLAAPYPACFLPILMPPPFRGA